MDCYKESNSQLIPARPSTVAVEELFAHNFSIQLVPLGKETKWLRKTIDSKMWLFSFLRVVHPLLINHYSIPAANTDTNTSSKFSSIVVILNRIAPGKTAVSLSLGWVLCSVVLDVWYKEKIHDFDFWMHPSWEWVNWLLGKGSRQFKECILRVCLTVCFIDKPGVYPRSLGSIQWQVIYCSFIFHSPVQYSSLAPSAVTNTARENSSCHSCWDSCIVMPNQKGVAQQRDTVRW